MAEWKKTTLPLQEDHTWRAKPGYKIFVVDRGTVRFEVPEHWVVVPAPRSTKFYDQDPPKDNCKLEVSVLRLPPMDWKGLPLPQLLQQVVAGPEEKVEVHPEDIHVLEHFGLEMAWVEVTHLDTKEHREALSCTCLARGSNIQVLMTFDYWAEDAASRRPIWNDVLHSLELGVPVQDPTKGPVLM